MLVRAVTVGNQLSYRFEMMNHGQDQIELYDLLWLGLIQVNKPGQFPKEF